MDGYDSTFMFGETKTTHFMLTIAWGTTTMS